MASSRSSSPSEGEIIEGDSEKATTSIEEQLETSVDRPSRKHYSISRSPSPYRASRDVRSRDDSRSPYRESRGSKRRQEDDHYGRSREDRRRLKIRHEDQTYDSKGYTRSLYHDRSQEVRPDRYASDKARLPNSRSHTDGQRARSRTPPASNHSSYKARKSGHLEDRSRAPKQHNHKTGGESRTQLSYQQSVSSRGRSPVGDARSRPETESNHHQTQHAQDRSARSELSTLKYAHQPLQRAFTNPVPISGTLGRDVTDGESALTAEKAPVDEATLIEERRKRREAIKAKHKGQETPMLVQNLAINDQVPPIATKSEKTSLEGQTTDPAADTQVAAATLQTANLPDSKTHTPNLDNEHDSPTDFIISKDADVVDSNAASAELMQDEPSAADYNPTMDMQEDKIRREQHQSKEEVAASSYDESAHMDKDVLLPASDSKPTLGNGGLDMFGDDDDLDMFAEPSNAPKKQVNTSTKAVPVPQAKALDMSMLDDCDDSDGYYKVILGELLDNRYLVQSNLGKGMFSGVVRATDQRTKGLVAIKLIRNNETMKKAGLKEIEILEKLASADPEDKKHLIRLERFFEHKGHLCMVFENLSINLREVLKKFGRDVGINIKAVREYAKQMFLGLSLMRRCNILHADLKPDNVLVNESRSMLKICDLGSASDASENEITQYLVSRFYRAPEIIIGLPYDFAIDMWSIGCTLFELYTGKILFTGRSNNQMLRAIMETRGKFSHKLLRKSEFAGLHFDDLLNFRSVEKDRLTGKDVVRVLNFTKPSRDLRTRIMANVKGIGEEEGKELTAFVDLLDKCLNLNPEKRCTPTEALRHPFITKSKS